MARCEPRVSCINIKKISKIKNISQFGLEQNVREGEKEDGEKKNKLLRRFYEVLQVGTRQAESLRCSTLRGTQDFAKVQGSGFHENREEGSVPGNNAI